MAYTIYSCIDLHLDGFAGAVHAASGPENRRGTRIYDPPRLQKLDQSDSICSTFDTDLPEGGTLDCEYGDTHPMLLKCGHNRQRTSLATNDCRGNTFLRPEFYHDLDIKATGFSQVLHSRELPFPVQKVLPSTERESGPNKSKEQQGMTRRSR
ncbi:hypothetical protein SODALDRAFT_359768 [Sodiomyces alkalinus F11]|uniref:Uncharacterized protein n=1 Tax=Sodiomyces alkalinus (strain CBS 110278 / VKM F-3762 / F11) TaxID=1314773 RepID=A0A3N2PVY7_SODAK|nr:hypothetical protein SODALDRAFT_359768 [Sodiomyces alkalinus F11]ROT38661.1 hypothetical protein SODALDRAFT_359768 [Sodiomyces alkalinus F11]